MNLKKEEYENVLDFSVDDERIIKYLKGETLEVEDLVSSKREGVVSRMRRRLSSRFWQAVRTDVEE